MVRTIIARDPVIGARRIYTKGIIIVTRSFHDKFYIVSMGMNTKVQGRSHFFNVSPFNSLLGFDEVVLLEFLSGVTPIEHNPQKFRGSPRWSKHRFNPSGYFYEFIRQPSEVRGTSLKVECRGPSRGYDSTKPLRMKGRTQGF